MDREAILAAEDDEALKELKLFLFKENIRLKNEQKELAEYKEKLLRERAQFRMEMDHQPSRICYEGTNGTY